VVENVLVAESYVRLNTRFVNYWLFLKLWRWCQTCAQSRLAAVLHHTRAVTRGASRALVVADMPFLTYQVSAEEALRNAARLFQEGGAAAVKLEGGRSVAEAVRRLTAAGLPVMGHVGLTPQHVHRLGGMRQQARDDEAAQELMLDADDHLRGW
jgi:3-methyl-2-oxobutanoate hydroxymethyltransferase